ncbi:response regulator [Candidatus Poribacteria bacterium]|nr:response regulator [Candidatus Poribacteria bacterium]
MSKEPQEPLFAEDNDELVFAEEDDDPLVFAEEDAEGKEQRPDCWKVLIVDDEPEVHEVTRLALEDFTFEGKSLAFISTYSGEEAKRFIQTHPDISLILLDVVMETDRSGLEVTQYIREELKNRLVRIILRTGHPGQAPEETVIIDYDINDYKTKTELTTQKLFMTVVTALRSFRDLMVIEARRQELQQLVAATERFVPHEFLFFLDKRSIVDVRLGDHVQMEMTILFSDIRSFVTLSEQMTPAENFEFINSYLQHVGPMIRNHHGFVGKYTGDGMMGLFPRRADDALIASIEIFKQLSMYNSLRQQQGRMPIRIGIGLHTGEVMLGTVGEEKRMQGDVMSDTVNLACRIESMTKIYGAPILISEQTRSRLQTPSRYALRAVDCVQVRGRLEPVTVYEVFDGDSPHLIKLKTRTRPDFEEGLRLYRQKKFAEALQRFNQVLQTNTQDQTASLYVKRCEHFQKYGVPAGWEGLWRHEMQKFSD